MPAVSPSSSLAPGVPRSELWLTLAAWGLLLVLLWTAACMAPLGAWNAPRLAAAYALAGGQSLYPDPASGAQLGWIYGPGFALWLLPITLITSPSAALAAAVMYNALGLFAAIFWVLRSAALPTARAAMLTAFFGLLLFASGLTAQSWLTEVHVDTPCLIFCLLALGAACRFDLTARPLWLHVAALAALAACLTKQTTAVLPVAMTLHWLWRRQWRTLGRWLGWFGGYAAIAFGLFLLFFDLGNAWHHLVQFHRLNQWKAAVTGVSSLPPVASALLVDGAVGLGVLALLLILPRRKKTPGAENQPVAVAARWCWWFGLIQLPIGILAAFKAGGGLNSAHGLLFILLAIVLRTAATPLAFWQRTAGLALLGALSLLPAQARLGQWRPSPYQDELLALAQSHRHAIYFPWNPLITLLTDGRIYPFEDALYCQNLSFGRTPPPAQLRATLPPRPLIVYDPIALTRTIGRYLPEAQPVSIYELQPAFARYRR